MSSLVALTNDRMRAQARNGNVAGYPYRAVRVLLLSWLDDDLGVEDEILALKNVFQMRYQFPDVIDYRIPSQNSENSINQQICQFKRGAVGRDVLLIVYYAGHGSVEPNFDNNGIGSPYMMLEPYRPCRHTPARECPALDWSSIQLELQRSPSDVLILLDACYSAGSVDFPLVSRRDPRGAPNNRAELIASCGFDRRAPGPSNISFTRALVESLEELDDPNRSFSVANLHRHILSKLLERRMVAMVPMIRLDDQIRNHQIEHTTTPVYIVLKESNFSSDILLRSFRVEDGVSPARNVRANAIPIPVNEADEIVVEDVTDRTLGTGCSRNTHLTR